MKIINESDIETQGLVPVTTKDEVAILNHIKEEIELTVDKIGRVWNEGGIYIADVKILDKEYDEDGNQIPF